VDAAPGCPDVCDTLSPATAPPSAFSIEGVTCCSLSL
jgi:hypothetical protein